MTSHQGPWVLTRTRYVNGRLRGGRVSGYACVGPCDSMVREMAIRPALEFLIASHEIN